MALTGPLHEVHIAANAKMAAFGGWTMPVEFLGGGVLAEHTAVREAVGIFDVSHLGKARISGPGAADFVNSCFAGDLGKITPGKAQYTVCCSDDGGVVDDLITYLRSPEEVFIMPNAANTAEVVQRLTDAAPAGVTVTEEHRDHAVFAVQGPKSDEVLAALGLPTGHEFMSYVDADFNGAPLSVCRTGYTGEKGYELIPRWDDAPALWESLLDGIAPHGGLPAGLGARDTLRTEMGYALHGHELSPTITPIEGGMSWAVGWSKPQFWGRDALLKQKEAGAQRRLKGLLATDRGVPRAASTVRDAIGDAEVGVTTSGTFSPTLKQGIALALLDRSVRFSDEVVVDVRGRGLRCQVVKPPFVTPGTKS